jgi:hypothetical protein
MGTNTRFQKEKLQKQSRNRVKPQKAQSSWAQKRQKCGENTPEKRNLYIYGIMNRFILISKRFL